MFFDLDNFHTPSSPLPKEKSSRSNFLLENISEFYSWYMFWDSRLEDRSLIYEKISRMLRIITISNQGGHFLTWLEEEKIAEAFDVLKDNLYQSNIKVQELPFFLGAIIDKSIEKNAKARLVDEITRVEYTYLIRTPSPIEEGVSKKIREEMEFIITQISPKLPDIHAAAVAKNLNLLLKKQVSLEELPEKLRLCYKNWL